MKQLGELVWKHALKNRVEYGKASPGAIAGKVIGEAPEAKKQMKELMSIINSKAGEANALSSEQAAKELGKYSFAERKEEGEGERQWNLPGCVEGKVVTRFLPEPNGLLHLGHAKSAWLSATLVEKWKGKLLLRFDDTNPETEKQEFVDAIRKDLQWLGLRFDGKESFSSDFLPQFYELAQKLLEKKKGFVCACSKEEIASNREKKKACACRKRGAKENLALWKQMRSGELKEGAAIVRFAGDMASENTVMRDPTLFRIIEAPHYRQGSKYCVWPTYDFEASVADSLSGVTHALRSKEYELRDELYYALLDALELRKPVVYDFSRLNISGSVLSKRLIKPLVESGKLLGWDDPRLLTLGGLRRRGILPQAIKKFVLSFGLSKVESSPFIDKLLSENRKLLDQIAERRFFVDGPVELVVTNHSKQVSFVRVSNHPLDKGKGSRELAVDGSFYVMGSDAFALEKGEVFRLKDLYNVKLVQKGKAKLSGEFVEGKQMAQKKIQWVPKNDCLECMLLVPDIKMTEKTTYQTAATSPPGWEEPAELFREDSLQERKGFCDSSCAKLSLGSVVQFERVGFARLDSKEGKQLVFIFSC